MALLNAIPIRCDTLHNLSTLPNATILKTKAHFAVIYIDPKYLGKPGYFEITWPSGPKANFRPNWSQRKWHRIGNALATRLLGVHAPSSPGPSSPSVSHWGALELGPGDEVSAIYYTATGLKYRDKLCKKNFSTTSLISHTCSETERKIQNTLFTNSLGYIALTKAKPL